MFRHVLDDLVVLDVELERTRAPITIPVAVAVSGKSEPALDVAFRRHGRRLVVADILSEFGFPGLKAYLIGMRPSLWAMISSSMQDVFSSKVTRSMAMVTTSAMITLRKALAMEASVFFTSKLIWFSSRLSTSTSGRRARWSAATE